MAATCRQVTNVTVVIMYFPGKLVSKLLVCLTAIAVPLQAGWVSSCACTSGTHEIRPTAAASPAPDAACSCEVTTPKRSCCGEDDTPQSTHCSKAVQPDRKVGCQCGAGCLCVKRDDSPNQLPAPAGDNGRARTGLEFAAVHVAAAELPADIDHGNTFSSDSDSGFFQSGTQICVLLCRFAL